MVVPRRNAKGGEEKIGGQTCERRGEGGEVAFLVISVILSIFVSIEPDIYRCYSVCGYTYNLSLPHT